MKSHQDISYLKYLFHEGKGTRSHELLGAHPVRSGIAADSASANGSAPEIEPVTADCSAPDTAAASGFRFRVWAPHAKAISVCGDWNGWNPKADPMTPLAGDPEIWEAVCPDANTGDCYKFAVTTPAGKRLYKADPYGFSAEPPIRDQFRQMASCLVDIEAEYPWEDQDWIACRSGRNPYTSPMNIYEVHLGSWKRHEDGSYYSYRETADELIPYAIAMGFTHLELLPLTEHPYDGSWGYQSTGYFAVTSRYGDPSDFQYFVNKAHTAGLGVLLDWVPAHFPRDSYGLIDFDGTNLYEDPDPFRQEHKGWGTRAFDFGRPEIRSFLISSAAFFCDVYHVDGIRVDAVSAMLYLDYGREEGKWRPNKNGGRENLEAVHFLRELNRAILTEFPGVLMIAEESTAWPLITIPPDAGGLGFNFKWNMGWMHDSLEYFQTDPLFRRWDHQKLTFSITYAWSENHILPISHDEVVHGKHSLLDKMPGEYDEKFAGLRAFYVYMITYPGKKLLFMGSEFGQFIEWNETQGLDWLLLDYDRHRQIREFLRELNLLYLDKRALWSRDNTPEGFRWIDADDADRNIFSWCRYGDQGETCLCVMNLSGREWRDVQFGVPEADYYEKVLDSDMKRFGGSGRFRTNKFRTLVGERHGHHRYISLNLPPLSAIILERRDDSHE